MAGPVLDDIAHRIELTATGDHERFSPLANGRVHDPSPARIDVRPAANGVLNTNAALTALPAIPKASAGIGESAPDGRDLADPPYVDDRVGQTLPSDVDVDLLADFLAESRECLAESEAALLSLERAPGDAEALNTVFRAFHTVKGTSAFLGLARLTTFAHGAESLLARVREGEVAYTSACAELALQAGDMLKALLDAVETAMRAGGPGSAVLLPHGYAALNRALASYDGGLAEVEAPGDAGFAVTPASDRRRGERRQDDRRQTAATSDGDALLRVRVARLDRLVDMVSELVIAQSMVVGDATLATVAAEHPDLAGKLDQTGKIVRELQQLSLGLRMVPLRATFQKLTRLVRDASTRVNKTVDLVTEGEDTEIDRTLVALVGDPLMHMVRNAIDHGIESPADRVAAGKPLRGTIRLSAYHTGGSVVVELVDDGRGLDRDRIVHKAIEKGLIASDQGMADAEVFALIFAPGFSTAEAVTDLSGRGVGMDVVRRNVERVRGRVEIASRAGEGSTFTLRLPLTLAVTDGMLVRIGTERYVIPTASMHVSFRPAVDAVQSMPGGGEFVTLRGETLPVVRLHELFGIDGAEHDPARALLVVVGDGRRRRAALLVDELLGQHQVVARALGDGIGRVEGIAGGAILGDGRVGLILDVAEVVALAEGDAMPLSRGPHAA